MCGYLQCPRMIHSIENPFIPSIPARLRRGEDENSSRKLAVGLKTPESVNVQSAHTHLSSMCDCLAIRNEVAKKLCTIDNDNKITA